MRRLVGPTRRAFGQSLGAALALIVPFRPGAAAGDTGPKVAIRGFAFEPAEVTIRRGETVRWVNRDVAPHTATSESAEWDTGGLEQDASAKITFADAGTFAYFCAYHPHMKGVVHVRG